MAHIESHLTEHQGVMIRRQMGELYFLIPQHEHARMSGRLARFYGNADFAPPDPPAETIRAAELHDCGWPLHDEQPTLSRGRLPTDVFESPLLTSLKMWSASADRVAEEAPYTQLLVSLHVLGLSAYAATKPRTHQELFELNKFQHREVERQVELRRKLGMSVEIPVYLGLAMNGSIPEEERLKRNHNIIQTMDRISLALCCSQVPAPRVEGIVPKVGAAAVTLVLSRPDATTVVVEPWPFDREAIELSLRCRVVAAKAYENEDELRSAYAGGEERELKFVVSA